MINLSYKIVRAEHHRKFAERCSENKVIPTGLDYAKKKIKVMKSPDDDDDRCFNEAIKHIQVLASQLTLEAMENHYFQLVLALQTKFGETSQKLLHCRQQLNKLVAEEEWVETQRADEESIDSLTNKLDKFSDKLANRRVRKLEKLQNPGAESNPPQEKHIKRTHNGSNEGKKPNKAREGKKTRSPPGCRNDRRDEQRVQRHSTHQLKGGKKRLPARTALKKKPLLRIPQYK